SLMVSINTEILPYKTLIAPIGNIHAKRLSGRKPGNGYAIEGFSTLSLGGVRMPKKPCRIFRRCLAVDQNAGISLRIEILHRAVGVFRGYRCS
ncbi:MAG: hypothetical protein ACXWWP_12425, partial [Candidatus Binatia bacterium]